jgi:hypothetical protein
LGRGSGVLVGSGWRMNPSAAVRYSILYHVGTSPTTKEFKTAKFKLNDYSSPVNKAEHITFVSINCSQRYANQ